MSAARPVIVLDTNIIVRATARIASPSNQIVDACLRGQFRLLLSRPVLVEYRNVLSYEEVIAMNPEIAGKPLKLLLERLRARSEYFRTVAPKFEFDRDPDDEKFIELAIVGNASHIITNDRDLLSLKDQHTHAAKRFRQRLPTTKIVTPPEFLASFSAQK